MRNAFLVLSFIALTATMCPPPPYRTKNIFTQNKADSNRIVLRNGLELTIRYSSLYPNSQLVGVAVFCELQNPTSYVQVLDRKNFSVFSSRSIGFEPSPMQMADETGLWFKLYTEPDLYPVAPKQKTDYVFIFNSTTKYSKKEAVEIFTSDTFFFRINGNVGADTLCKIVADDRRIRR